MGKLQILIMQTCHGFSFWQMEESKAFTLHSSFYSLQHPSGESHGNLTHGTLKVNPDRQTPAAFSTGGFQSVLPGVHVLAINSVTSSMKQSHVSDTQFASTSLKPSTGPLGKDSPLLSHHAGTPHLRIDGQINGLDCVTQAQGNAQWFSLFFLCICFRDYVTGFVLCLVFE